MQFTIFNIACPTLDPGGGDLQLSGYVATYLLVMEPFIEHPSAS